MDNIQFFITAIAGIILFLFGLENFSREIKLVAGDSFRKFISRWTRNPVIAIFLGTMLTALVQSSTATSVITVSLVNSGIISFTNSLGLIFGANIGSSITSQLVAFKLLGYAPLLILLGFFLSLVKNKYSFLGKSVFYFGFVFFSLNLISDALLPMKDNPYFLEVIQQTNTVVWGLLIGFVVTAVVNSSSVTIGLLVILAQQHLISIEQALPIILGAKIGTTLTAAISAMGMGASAKKTALAHVLFNVGGAVLFVPLLPYSDLLYSLSKEPGQILANSLLVFNLASTLVFLIFIKYFEKLVTYLIKEPEELVRQPFADVEKKANIDQNLNDVLNEIVYAFHLFEDGYLNSVVGIEANHDKLMRRSEKIRDTIDFYRKEISERLKEFSKKEIHSMEAETLIKVFQVNEYLTQMINYLNNMDAIFGKLNQRNLRLSLKMIFSVRAVTQAIYPILTLMEEEMRTGVTSSNYDKLVADFEKITLQENEVYLKRLIKNDLTSGNFFVDFLTMNNRMVEDLADFKKKMVQLRNRLNKN